jgi:large subunit ribosomal protein L10
VPTERKIQAVEELRERIAGSSIIISTDYTGMSVSAITNLRRVLREKGIQFHVVKNTLAYLAADAAERPAIKEIVQGPTGIVFGSGDPTEPARTVTDFIRTTRSPLKIRGGVLSDRKLTTQEVEGLATLPSREVLIARLMGQLQGPVASLVYVLNAPIGGLARVLQQHVENLSKAAATPPAGGVAPAPGGPEPQAAPAPAS